MGPHGRSWQAVDRCCCPASERDHALCSRFTVLQITVIGHPAFAILFMLGWRFILFKKLGLDERVATGLGTRLVPMVAGPLSSIITVYCLTKEVQGLFYLFGSLLALRTLFELGANTAVIQISAQARTSAESGSSSKLDPAFVVAVGGWTRKAACIYGIAAGMIGVGFLVNKGYGSFATLSAWLGFIGISALQFASEGRWALLQGADQIAAANRLRIKNSLLQYITQWSLLLLGAGLFSFVGASIVSYVSQEYTFKKCYSWLYASGDILPDRSRCDFYRRELMMLIRKAGQTYLTGYFVFQMQQPICFQLLGAASSARLGFTQSIGAGLIGIPSIWLAMNFPQIAHSVVDGDTIKAKRLFAFNFKRAIGLTCLVVAGAWLATLILGMVGRGFKDRLMDSTGSLVLFAGLGLQTVGLALTYWPRAFRVEPFVVIAYVQMVATPVLLYVLGKYQGLNGIAVAIFSSWLIGACGILFITGKFWRSPPPVPRI